MYKYRETGEKGQEKKRHKLQDECLQKMRQRQNWDLDVCNKTEKEKKDHSCFL